MFERLGTRLVRFNRLTFQCQYSSVPPILQQARVEGHKLGREDQVRHMQRELQEDIYKEADSRHRDMLIRLRVSLSHVVPLPLGPFPSAVLN